MKTITDFFNKVAYEKFVENAQQTQHITSLDYMMDINNNFQCVRAFLTDENVPIWKHIIQTIAVYNKLKIRDFTGMIIKDESLGQICRVIDLIENYRGDILYYILLFHDIGKFIDKFNHGYQSESWLFENQILTNLKFNEAEIAVIHFVVKYHLDLGAINSGEYSYYTLIKWIDDPLFLFIAKDRKLLALSLDILFVLTIIDIGSYDDLKRITDTTCRRLTVILDKLKAFFADDIPSRDEYNQRLISLSTSDYTHRLACYLRAFADENKSANLTKEFFNDRVIQSIQNYSSQSIHDFYVHNLSFFYKIQFNYALWVIIRMTFKTMHDFRTGCTRNTMIDNRVLYLLEMINNRIKSFELENADKKHWDIWNVFFLWDNKNIELLENYEMKTINDIVNNSIIEYQEEASNTIKLILNFKINFE